MLNEFQMKVLAEAKRKEDIKKPESIEKPDKATEPEKAEEPENIAEPEDLADKKKAKRNASSVYDDAEAQAAYDESLVKDAKQKIKNMKSDMKKAQSLLDALDKEFKRGSVDWSDVDEIVDELDNADDTLKQSLQALKLAKTWL
tara:strand:+ start:312 stop:743 length:432 start_codon:yes stop_codon:yes gene_type:complete